MRTLYRIFAMSMIFTFAFPALAQSQPRPPPKDVQPVEDIPLPPNVKDADPAKDIKITARQSGTDTIEETAFLLDLVLTSPKPVVLVGAMRTVSDPSWDGPANLIAAVRVAATEAARGLGVLVVMDDHVFPAREVRKLHTESSGSFSTPEFGPLGVVDSGRVVLRRRTVARPMWQDRSAEPGMRVQTLDTRVALIQAYTGMDDFLIRAIMHHDIRGLAIVAFGRGNVPPAIVPVIADAVRSGLLVTVSSRSMAGRVEARYGYDGGGLQLRDAGAVLAGDLSASQARLLQMVALGLNPDVAQAADLIRHFADCD